MFDWARGSMVKKFIELNLFRANWIPLSANWLKNWHTPWLLGLIEFRPEMRVLDVGSATPNFMKHLHDRFGCEVHALDAEPNTTKNAKFGFQEDATNQFAKVQMHVGLAGDYLLPAEHYDVVTCISTLEHTYDHDSPVLAHRPMPHLNALRDMVRMLKPGGVFLMNWDLFLDNIPQNLGWDFEVDYKILKASGMRLLNNRRRLRNVNYLFAHPDTLFFDPASVLRFELGQLRRGTSINMLWQKPGNVANVRIAPHPELEALYFPDGETTTDSAENHGAEPTTDEIDERFLHYISRITDVLGRSDVDGLN